MMLTFQLTRVINNIIDNLKKPLTVKGTNNTSFKEYQSIFNAMSYTDKKFLLVNLIHSRGRLIRHGIRERQDIHLEQLGTFEYKEDREMFLSKLNEKINHEGYSQVKLAPLKLKAKLVKEVTAEMDSVRLDKYYSRLEKNKKKRTQAVPISIKLAIGGNWSRNETANNK